MAVQTLMSGATVDGLQPLVATLAGPATIQVLGTSAFGGAVVKLMYTHVTDTDGEYSLLSKSGNLTMDSSGVKVDVLGDYFLKAFVVEGTSSPDSVVLMRVSQ